MFDPNMEIALNIARGLATAPPALPAALIDIRERAAFLAEIDKPLLVDVNGVAQWEQLGAHLRAIAKSSVRLMPELSSDLDRVAVALAIWAGCIMAAKAIAFETRSGENTVAGRTQAFTAIDELAAQDPLFRAGVEAAPVFKTQRDQTYSLDGVPSGSPVRRYAGRGEGEG